MKMVKKLPVLLLVVASFLMPKQSHAGIIGDFLRELFGNNNNGNHDNHDDDKKDKKAPQSPWSNSVPIDGGIVLLLGGGLMLGTKMLIDAKAQKSKLGGA